MTGALAAAVGAIAAGVASIIALWSVLETRKNLQATERPWLLITNIAALHKTWPGPKPPGEDGYVDEDNVDRRDDYINIRMTFTNYGKGPAFNVRATFTSIGVDEDGKEVPFRNVRVRRGGVEVPDRGDLTRMLAPAQSFAFEELVLWPEDGDWEEDVLPPIFDGRLFARVTYDDQFGVNHVTQLCRQFVLWMLFDFMDETYACPGSAEFTH